MKVCKQSKGGLFLLLAISLVLLFSCSQSNYYLYKCYNKDNGDLFACKKQIYLKTRGKYFSITERAQKHDYDSTSFRYIKNPEEKDFNKMIFADSIRVIKLKDWRQYFKYSIKADSLFVSGYSSVERKKNKAIGLFSIKKNNDSSWHRTVSFSVTPFTYDYIWEAGYTGDTTLKIDNQNHDCYIIEERIAIKHNQTRIFIDKSKLIPVCLEGRDGITKILSFNRVR